MGERRQRKPRGNRLARILIAHGWTVRTSPPPWGYEKAWDFRRVGNTQVPLNAKAAALMQDFEHRWPDSNWPPDFGA